MPKVFCARTRSTYHTTTSPAAGNVACKFSMMWTRSAVYVLLSSFYFQFLLLQLMRCICLFICLAFFDRFASATDCRIRMTPYIPLLSSIHMQASATCATVCWCRHVLPCRLLMCFCYLLLLQLLLLLFAIFMSTTLPNTLFIFDYHSTAHTQIFVASCCCSVRNNKTLCWKPLTTVGTNSRMPCPFPLHTT